MKKLTVAILASLLVYGCDSPRTQRSVLSSKNNNAFNLGNGSITNPPAVVDDGDDDETPASNSNIPEDAKHCKFSSDGVNGFASNSTHLGPHTLCQSSLDKNIFYFQVKTPPVGSNGDVSICFIPTTSSGSNSIYVGNPMCGAFTNPKEVKKITFVKYTQYSNALINGVIFFKDTSYYYPVFNRNMMTMDAYKICMNMLAYGQSAYCEAFKSVGQYVYTQF